VVYTWHGCTIEVTGSCDGEYPAEETPMVSYVNTHFAIEKMRQIATSEKKEGPVVLVVGSVDSGKTSLVKILTAYAVKMGRQPLVVNLDTREGMLSLPGTISAASFSTRMDVQKGWGSSPTSGPNSVPVKLPLTYYYGSPQAEDNPKLFKALISQLAIAVNSKIQEDESAKEAGVIIDTPGSISQGIAGSDIIQHVMSEFPGMFCI
jgi:polyribonucleotide 5'-hydroxyl-kinase